MDNISTLDSNGDQKKDFRLETKNPGNNHIINKIATHKVTYVASYILL